MWWCAWTMWWCACSVHVNNYSQEGKSGHAVKRSYIYGCELVVAIEISVKTHAPSAGEGTVFSLICPFLNWRVIKRELTMMHFFQLCFQVVPSCLHTICHSKNNIWSCVSFTMHNECNTLTHTRKRKFTLILWKHPSFDFSSTRANPSTYRKAQTWKRTSVWCESHT